ncbi:MAG: helix-turn-helix transcriptional regulator [Bacilli bacterium]|nr:helix-turn-helix transcriptional regulator [Bacilli bacterium]
MAVRHFNSFLRECRLKKGISLKDAAKQIKISRLRLLLLERGYLKPNMIVLSKLEKFYQEDLAHLLLGEASYPEPVETYKSSNRFGKINEWVKSRFGRIILASVCLFSAGMTAAGIILFSNSTHVQKGHFGSAYETLMSQAFKDGEPMIDPITGEGYRSIVFTEDDGVSTRCTFTLNFYEQNTLIQFSDLFFSIVDYSKDIHHVYQFGSNMSVSSNRCIYTYGDWKSGVYARLTFDYYEKGVIGKIINFDPYLDVTKTLTEEFVTTQCLSTIEMMHTRISTVLSTYAEMEMDLLEDFIPARESGRTYYFTMQIIGIVLLVSGVFIFFSSFFLLAYSLATSLKFFNIAKSVPNQVEETIPIRSKKKRTYAELPSDTHPYMMIPESAVKAIAHLLLLVAVAFYVYLGIRTMSTKEASPSADALGVAASVCFFAGIFLVHFLNYEIMNNRATIIATFFLYAFVFVMFASVETILLKISEAWGFTLSNLVSGHIPSNIFGVSALLCLIQLFLFFHPKFLVNAKKWQQILWHCLSFIPLGLLVLSYVLGALPGVVYGMKSDPYAEIWFTQSFICLALVSALYLYGTFGLQQYFLWKYGPVKSKIYFNGTRFNLWKNATAAVSILIIGLLDLLLMNNNMATYWGFGNSYWILLLIPIVLLRTHHIGPRNKKLDSVFGVLYFILYWASFINILMVILSSLI